jgi:hypothetical protein
MVSVGQEWRQSIMLPISSSDLSTFANLTGLPQIVEPKVEV